MEKRTPPFSVGMTVELKKPHPCGSRAFTVVRTGADIKLRCNGCAHTVLMSMSQVKKAIRPIPALKRDTE